MKKKLHSEVWLNSFARFLMCDKIILVKTLKKDEQKENFCVSKVLMIILFSIVFTTNAHKVSQNILLVIEVHKYFFKIRNGSE